MGRYSCFYISNAEIKRGMGGHTAYSYRVKGLGFKDCFAWSWVQSRSPKVAPLGRLTQHSGIGNRYSLLET